MTKSKIKPTKSGSLSEADRLVLALLLIKAGYVVRIDRERKSGKSNGAWEYFVEYWED
jgi:hypothetical protein